MGELKAKPKDDAISAEQARQNLTTRNQWQLFASHRGEIEKLIVPESRGGQLCVLGAGNCNDLDLKWLVDVYSEVHLVDLDRDALIDAVQRQGLGKNSPEESSTARGAIHIHAPFDLTGIAAQVADWQKSPPTLAEIEQAARVLLQPPKLPAGEYDLVLSPCVLTQMMNPVRDALRAKYPPSHPARVAMSTALRTRHLRTIAASLRPGGRGVLVIDLISPEKFAGLSRLPREELADFMRKFVADGRHYAGLDPGSLAAALQADPGLSKQVGPPQFVAPWLWHLGLRKTFLVYAATFRRLFS